MSHASASILSSAEAQTLAIVAGAIILGTPVAIWRYLHKNVVKPLQAFPQLQEDIAAAVVVAADNKSQLIEMRSDLMLVKAEVFTNHGSSLRDSTNRNEVLTRAIAEVVGIDPDSLVPHQSPPDEGVA